MIALDANGADRGPRTVAEGGAAAGVPVTIFGPAAELGRFENVVDPVAVTNYETRPSRCRQAGFRVVQARRGRNRQAAAS